MELAVPGGLSLARAIRMSSGAVLAVSSFQMWPRDTVSTTRRPADSANIEINVWSERPGADWSFGIHGQPDKTVCLMTYWHVDRHFSSCGARRLSTGAGAISCAHRPPPVLSRLGVRAMPVCLYRRAPNTTAMVFS